ncbi:cytokine receptor common subunit gamma-like isoform X3 [Stegostoma tigrinum]|uniref:cytokine receptor common subunit gamma-like isoform X3 n=1 Tax=Stegostoma tigrinum TaxID=3053191 RepID=UPI00287004C2|nr:cytokine receptor common subunit gamma-like isoform X3 [Stegostoma tigrinum]
MFIRHQMWIGYKQEYLSKPRKECGNYIQENGYNVGCYFSKEEIIEFEYFNIYRNGSSNSGKVLALTQTFQLQNQVKLNPPGNLTLNMFENNELLLTWDPPAKLLKCQMYEIRHRSNKDKDWQVQVINAQTKYILPSVDPKKFYTFQVRSKINQYCANAKLWSEWSPAIQWEKNLTQSGKSHGKYYLWVFLIALGLSIIVLSLLKLKRDSTKENCLKSENFPYSKLLHSVSKGKGINSFIKVNQHYVLSVSTVEEYCFD